MKAMPAAETAVIAFISKKGAFVKDLKMERATCGEAAAWCDRQYHARRALHPPRPLRVVGGALPRSAEAGSALPHHHAPGLA